MTDTAHHSLDDTLRELLRRRLAGFERLDAAQAMDSSASERTDLKRAAVAVTLVDARGEAGFLLTRRADSLRTHAGQWALPGGRCDANESAADAARRELHEELGLEVGERQVLGLLDDYPTRSGYLITPVVIWAGQGDGLRANPAEVQSVHRIRLREIQPAGAVDFVRIAESDRPVVRFRIQHWLIHAPTAAVIFQFRELLAGRCTRVVGLEQPPFAWR